jgi:hypothetical protein
MREHADGCRTSPINPCSLKAAQCTPRAAVPPAGNPQRAMHTDAKSELNWSAPHNYHQNTPM